MSALRLIVDIEPVSAKCEPSLRELISDIENWRLETVRKKSPMKVELEQIPQLRDLFSGANLRKYRRHF